ncbi:RNA-directed DNA polymerase, eukaryota [Tanacetum coccineum]
MNFLSLNIQGLGNKAKKGWIQELNTKHRVDFVALQEIKMKKMNLFSIKALWGILSFDYAFSPSIGYSGGILCVWDPRLFFKDNSTISDSFLAISGTWIPSSTKLLVISVYAPQDLTKIRTLWDFIHYLIDSWDGEYVLLGDFKEVRFEHGWHGSLFNSHGANSFNNFITRTGLIDLPLEGYSFTCAHKSASKMSKLDRFLISECLLALFSSISALCLDKHLSEHRPILLRELNVDYGPTPFWSNLLKELQDFNKSSSLDTAQKAKIRWAIEGDENSKFFHGIINKKRSQLAIRGVLADGDWIVEPSLVKNEFLKHFATHFAASSSSKIKRAVWDCGISKSPGPDGFTFEFYRKYWSLIDHEVVAAVTSFFSTGSFPPGCNSLFITLIPKLQEAKMVKDFPPISLIGSMYKIITKVLANRLSLVISELVSDVQSAFISNRHILDGPFILNELLSWSNFGFGLKWRSWIQGCLNFAMGSILVNGSPTSEFKFSKRLKLGDPLSPFFILIMKSLHLSFNNVVDAGLYNGIQIDESLNLSHLFYADDVIFVVAKSIGCSILHTPFKYLGVKLKSLSIGGRLTLIKTVLSSLSLYHMSSFKVHKGVLSKMESIRRNFFNGVENAEKKMLVIGWNKILASKKNGGLGFSSFFSYNGALLFKWIWRFLANGASIWSRFISAIYGIRGALDNSSSYSRRSPWLDIVNEVRKLASKGIDLLSLVKKKVGNGEATSFWNDVWLGDFPLKQTYPRLYFLELDKHVSVASKLRANSLISSFRRSPRSGIEEEQLLLLISNTSSVILPNISDRWSWLLDPSGDFSVKSTREFIDDSMLPKTDVPTRWVKSIPIKINIFAWRVSLDKLPTRLNLSLRGLDIPSIICPLCSIAVESTSHLLFSCQLARQLMIKVVHWWELEYQDFHSYEDWLLWFKNLRVSKRLKDVFEGVCYISWWVIWKFRNQVLFGINFPRLDLLFDDIVRLSFHWCSSRCSSNFDWNTWMKNPSSIIL